MKKIDVLQVFISSSAIVGIGLLWINFNVKVFQTVWDLVKSPFSEDAPKAGRCRRRWINLF